MGQYPTSLCWMVSCIDSRGYIIILYWILSDREHEILNTVLHKILILLDTVQQNILLDKGKVGKVSNVGTVGHSNDRP